MLVLGRRGVLRGTVAGMRHPDGRSEDEARTDRRAELLPEEHAAGSDVPHEQAAAILEESDRRTDDPEGTQHASTQTPDEGR